MREIADSSRLKLLMLELGKAASRESTVYLTGGATAVLYGWRDTTLDADIKILPEDDELLRAVSALKEKISINVELAAPDQFIPPLPGWQERSVFIAKEGPVVFRHYDFYAQALSKLARGHDRDILDARSMRDRGLIENKRLLEFFRSIEPLFFRYPALDVKSFQESVEKFTA